MCGPEEWRAWGLTNCGKGEPGQVMAVSHGAAPARFRDVQVGVALSGRRWRSPSARSAHATGEAQATVMRERSLLSRFARSQPDAGDARSTTRRVSILRVHDGHTGSADTNDLSDDGLRDVAARADAGARAAAAAAGGRGEYPGLPAPRRRPAPAPTDGFDAATAALDPAVAGAALRGGVRRVRGARPRGVRDLDGGRRRDRDRVVGRGPRARAR